MNPEYQPLTAMKRLFFLLWLYLLLPFASGQAYDSIIDVRDGQKYTIVKIGDQWWMAENLNIGTYKESIYTGVNHPDVSNNAVIEKYCYDNDTNNCIVYGGLYDWNEMMIYNPSDDSTIGTTQGICPAGWHLPTDPEWDALITYIGGATVAGGKLKEEGTSHWNSPNVDATNEYGFSAFGAGRRHSDGSFISLGDYGNFWTSTQYDAAKGWRYVVEWTSGQSYRFDFIKSNGLSIRCTRDSYPIEITLSGTNTSSINGHDGSIDLQVKGGKKPFIFSWSNGETTEDISDLTEGIYSVTVTDANDSSATDSIRIYDTFVDERDGQRYKAVRIGDQIWMAENLNVGTRIEGISGSSDNMVIEKYCFEDFEANCDTFGGFYQWDEMMQYNPSDDGDTGTIQGVCPVGWHIPTDNEWKILEEELGVDAIELDNTGWRGTDEGGMLKDTGTCFWNDPNTGATNSIGYSALGTGYRSFNGTFWEKGLVTHFWSATEYGAITTEAFKRQLSNTYATISRSSIQKTFGYPVRCVRDIIDPLTIALEGTNTSSIRGNDGAIDLTINGGLPSYHVNWSDGSTTEDVAGLSAGVYTVTVTDTLGTQVIDSIRIYDTFVDERDGQRYKAVKIGGQVWMAENLNYYTPTESMYYDNDSATYADTYGRLYWLATARQVCPSGWHLPTDDEWKILEKELGMPEEQLNLQTWRGTNEGGKIKEAGLLHWSSPNTDATNETGFSALPAGAEEFGSFYYIGLSADFWVYSYSAWMRTLSFSNGGIARGKLPGPDRGLSVRCIIDIDTLKITLDPTHTTQINGQDGAVDLTITGGLQPFNISWSEGSTTEDLSELSAGEYAVTVTDSRDSTVIDTIRIYDTFVDDRDSKIYKAVTIGDQVWMAENLNHGTRVYLSASQSDNETIEKFCYSDNELYCDMFGGLYKWNEAMQYNPSDNGVIGTTKGICPTGWHLPTDDEWKSMEIYLGMSKEDSDNTDWRGTDEGGKLKQAGVQFWYPPNTGATNETGFNGLPSGYSMSTNSIFTGIGEWSSHWTATEFNSTYAWFRDLNYSRSDINRRNDQKGYGFAIRCVKNPQDCMINEIQLSKTDIICNGTEDGAVELSITGSGVNTISWSIGDTTQSITGLPAGWYSVIVTDSVGCSLKDSTEILEPSPLWMDINDCPYQIEPCGHVSAPGASDGAAAVIPYGGTPPYIYLWDDDLNTTDSLVTGLSAYIWYHVTVTDANGCIDTGSVYFYEPGILEGSITDSTNISCYGLADGTATVSFNGGFPPVTFLWDDDSASTTQTVTGLAANRWYRVVISDNGSQSITDSIVLSEPDPIIIEKEVKRKICTGNHDGYISLDVSGGTSPYDYHWNTGETTPNIIDLGIGKYHVTVTDANGCVEEDSVQIDSITTFQDAEICMVTVTKDNRIVVVWEKDYNESIAAYNIYREITKDNYIKIATVPFDSLSIYVDDASVPTELPHLYKISITDSCGIVSDLSPYHKSIHLQTNAGLSNEVNLSWSEYEGFDYYEYEIFRGKSLDNLLSIRSITSSVRAWTDENPPYGDNFYRIMVVKPEPCYPTRLKTNEYDAPFSNYDQETIVGMNEISMERLVVYPNPFNESTMIQFFNPEKDRYRFYITDLAGKVVYFEDNIYADQIEFNRGNLPDGMYFVELRGSRIYRERMIIE